MIGRTEAPHAAALQQSADGSRLTIEHRDFRVVVIPRTLRGSDREQDRLAPRERLRPSVRALVLGGIDLRQRLEPAAAGGYPRQAGGVVGRENDGVVVRPGRAALRVDAFVD